jgi:hypothetical protein
VFENKINVETNKDKLNTKKISLVLFKFIFVKVANTNNDNIVINADQFKDLIYTI